MDIIKYISLAFLLFVFSIGEGISQNSICESAMPICFNGTPQIVINTTNYPNQGNYGCLASVTNPSWFYLQIADAGSVDIRITQGDNLPDYNNFDADVICWGPLSTLSCNNLYDYPSGNISIPYNIIACSYSTSSTENISIQGAEAGEYYMILVTNFSNQPGNVTLTQTNENQTGAATTDCSILNLDDSIENNKIIIYPNPIIDFLNLNFLAKKKDLYAIKVTTISGVKILETKINTQMQNLTTLELPNLLTSGIYLIEIRNSKNEKEIHKFIKE